MATKLKVTYADGKTVEVVATPRAMVMAEQFFRGIGDKNGVQASYYTAWASLNRAGKEAAEYETWLDSIDEVAQVGKSLREAVQELLEDRDLDETPEAVQLLHLAEQVDTPVEDADPTKRDRSLDSSSSSASAPVSPSTPSST